jgi:hypothetical protein
MATKGVVNATALNNVVLPSNALINEYGFNQGNLFKLFCKATYVEAPSFKGKDGKVNLEANPPKDPIQFEAICNADSFSLTHSHKFGDAGGLVGRAIDMFKDGGALTALKGIADFAETGTVPVATDWNTFSGLDTAKAYQGTDPLSFELSLILAAHQDPLLEVVLPAAHLTLLTYPTASNIQNTDALVKQMEKVLGKLSKAEKDRAAAGENDPEAQQAAKDSADKMERLQNGVKATGIPQNVKYRVGNPPPIWAIESSNGIISMDSCHVSSLNITYHGPWLSSPSIEQESERVETVNNALQMQFGSGKSLESIFAKQDKGSVNNIKDMQTAAGYPSWAEVKMTFTNNFSMMFGEDIVKGIMSSGKTKGSAV